MLTKFGSRCLKSELLVKLRLFGLLSLLGIHKLDKKKLIFEDLIYESLF